MNKEAMKLALEALEGMYIQGFTQDDSPINNAIIALREELAKPDFWEGYVPEPDKRQQALDKKAENARELGLDYEPPTYTFKTPSEPLITVINIKPNYNMTFHRDGKQVGVLDFNGPEMTFSGDMDESAKLFLNWVVNSFKGRLEQERAAEREACAKVCEEMHPGLATKRAAEIIRARSNT